MSRPSHEAPASPPAAGRSAPVLPQVGIAAEASAQLDARRGRIAGKLARIALQDAGDETAAAVVLSVALSIAVGIDALTTDGEPPEAVVWALAAGTELLERISARRRTDRTG